MESRALGRLSNENSRSCATKERSESLLAKLARFYSVVGSRPDEPGALALMSQILAQSGSDEQIDGALTRCARECRYPIRLPDILQRMEGQEVPQLEAEGRKAWEVAVAFAEKWVRSDVNGSYVIDRGVRSSEPPKLTQRVLDSVRRSGGWRAYKCMTHEDYPFLQRRFLEEYAAWAAIEEVSAAKLLTEAPRLQLVAKPDAHETKGPTPRAKPAEVPPFKPKPIPSPLTDVQLRDRRAMLRQQAELLAAKKTRL